MGTLSGLFNMLHTGGEQIMGTVGNIAARDTGFNYHALEYECFKMFEALIDGKQLDGEQKQFYEQLKYCKDDKYAKLIDSIHKIVDYHYP
ncbi:MAG: hypothetical protein EZS28_006821 [Streblomastix strix]|uniref:Uncharacterized protein n=1 Tax=Streblomastix strix TaxID=222440 RepID=A0A5J4WRV4_9EUKA|nr:MAG: hypothetical protein EZS28_006821 [Streblomastix strix]